ncbi:DHA1 family bicyclomycin/chloramphenicol resistance-like MFS transporter [Crenobacter luteus]|uniref:multidrug effflux MFS transporter n=1 Tax=Crenobacter luteus TaxID=1452487 RepID=UPI00104F0B01|nr:multidrug effflux MFS transporter [Crenobacter luteus]TCP13067.1 DHA1 family bicyclomycin/chloramphenicol resistance-like MFS transporter [Crenobacter luteus]
MTPDTRRTDFRLAMLLAALATLGPFSIDTFLPAMRAIGASLAASPIAIQQALTVYLFFYGLMMLWHGAISDAVGRRPVVLATTLLFALASLGCALADDLPTLLVFRALQGICGGAGLIVGRAIIRDRLAGAAAQKLMSQVTMLFSLSPAIAPVVGGWLFGAFGWHSIFVFMALIGAALFVASAAALPETLAPPSRQKLAATTLLSNYWQVLKKPEFDLLALAVSFNFAGFFLYVPSAPVFLMQHLKLSPQAFLWMFGPAVSGIMFGAFLSGRLAGRYSARTLVSFGYTLMFAAASANLAYHLFFPAALPWSVLPLTLYTIGMSVVAPTITLLLMDQFPHLRGTVSSLQGFTQTMLSSLTAGVISPLVWGSPLTLAAAMFAMLTTGFAMRTLFRRRLAAAGR